MKKYHAFSLFIMAFIVLQKIRSFHSWDIHLEITSAYDVIYEN